MNNVENAERDRRILGIVRLVGYAFAVTLAGIVGIAMVPNHFFIVSARALVNAPVQVITAPIYGRVNEIDLQVGQSVIRGQTAAAMSNPNMDQTSLNGLRLEKLDITERLNGRTDTLKQRQHQLDLLVTQIQAVKNGVVGELEAVVENAQATVNLYQARVQEQDALLSQQDRLARKGIVNPSGLEPLRQKRNAAQFELDSAMIELKRHKLVQSLVEKDVYTGGAVSNDLVALELQRKTLAASVAEDEVELRQMESRNKELDRLIGREEGRVGKSETAKVIAQHDGQIVSVDASFGEFLTQGQPLARSLNCSEAFVAAVYSARDVADVPIGTKALVNFRSVGKKKTGVVSKIVRFFDTGSQSRYFQIFPKAEGNEVYVLVKIDEAWDDAGTNNERNDKFFGCHVGDEVIVSLGEPITAKIASLYSTAMTSLLSGQAVGAANASAQPAIAKADQPAHAEPERETE